MGDERKEQSDASFASALVAAGRAERPRNGAKTRALEVVLADRTVARAVFPEARPHRLRLRTIAGYLLVAAALLVGIGVKHQGDVQAAEIARARQELADQTAKVDKLMAQLREQADSVASLQSAVQSAKDDRSRAAAQQALVDALRRSSQTGAALSRAGSGAPGRASKPACNCAPGDPLCSCIP